MVNCTKIPDSTLSSEAKSASLQGDHPGGHARTSKALYCLLLHKCINIDPALTRPAPVLQVFQAMPMMLTCDTRDALSPQLGNRHPRRPVAQGIRRERGQRSRLRVDPEGGHAARCLPGGKEKLVLGVQA
jgi:hypothetical protein